MRSALTIGGVGAAGILLASAFAAAPAAAAPGEGTVIVTLFEDRYTDGVFDPTDVNPNGQIDAVRTSNSLYLFAEGDPAVDTDDEWYGAAANAEGQFVFPNIPVGPASVHTVDPSGSLNTTGFWDATDPENLVRAEGLNYSFVDGTFFDDDGTVLSTTLAGGGAGARADFVIAEGDNVRTIGMAQVGAYADVLVDGTPTTGVAEVAFFSNGEEFAPMEWQPGEYLGSYGGSGFAQLVPRGIGITVDPERGYRVEAVTARSNINSGLDLEVTETDGLYTVDAAALPLYFDDVVFEVVLAPVPLTDLTVTYFDDNALDGVYDTADQSPTGETDEKRVDGYAYVQDAEGDWYATSANEAGDYVFPGVAAGEVSLYLDVPNVDESTAVWNASGVTSYEEIVEVAQEDISFAEGTYFDPAGGEGPIEKPVPALAAVLPLTLAEGDATVAAGSAAVTQEAVVMDEEGAPSDKAAISFLAGDISYSAEAFDEQAFYAAEGDGSPAYLAPADYALDVVAQEGFDIVEVTATSAETGEELLVASAAALPAVAEGTWTVAPTALATADDRVLWTVVVGPEEDAGPGTEEPPGDGDGDGDGGSGTPAPGTGGDDLASTGLDAMPYLLAGLIALALLAVGAGSMIVRRRNAE